MNNLSFTQKLLPHPPAASPSSKFCDWLLAVIELHRSRLSNFVHIGLNVPMKLSYTRLWKRPPYHSYGGRPPETLVLDLSGRHAARICPIWLKSVKAFPRYKTLWRQRWRRRRTDRQNMSFNPIGREQKIRYKHICNLLNVGITPSLSK